ncbi:MAG: adenosylcobinamide-GDP ribazoletransferase, partial [Candidatus Omnitrophota bacterium]|nr:adenosylcobinamide-GDP ribazoletransferase [Candidatus Omnitrophota bacterium]
RIMRDSHTGVMGILSIIIIILLKIAFLYSIDRRMFIPALILMCVLSRWALVGLMFFFPYARQDGKAKIFIQGINYRIVLICSLITLGIVIVAWPFGGILVLLLAGLSAYSFARFINSKIGGITGDTLGAACEIVETAVLFSILFLRR